MSKLGDNIKGRGGTFDRAGAATEKAWPTLRLSRDRGAVNCILKDHKER